MSTGLLIVLFSFIAGMLIRWIIGKVVAVPEISAKLRLIFIVIILLGATMTVYQSIHLQSYAVYKSWVMIHGKVVKAEITTKLNYSKPIITYAYTVNGNDYTGLSDMEVPGFGGKQKMFDVAESTVRSLAPGSIIPVFYDPEHPEISKIRVTPTWNVFAQIGFGAFLVAGACFAALLPRKR